MSGDGYFRQEMYFNIPSHVVGRAVFRHGGNGAAAAVTALKILEFSSSRTARGPYTEKFGTSLSIDMGRIYLQAFRNAVCHWLLSAEHR